MDQYAFELTPRSGERLNAADELAQQANLLGLAVGHRVRETSFGRNAALRLALSGLRRFVRQEFGELALTELPVVDGLSVAVPPMNLHLRGDTLTLRGPEQGGSQRFDLAGLAPGNYALVLESWVSLVGATTFGQASEPAIYAGVVDQANKPDERHFYEAGNVAGKGLPDAVFADVTPQITKALQRQYRLSLIPDRNLIGYQSDLVPAGTTYAITRVPELVQALVPEGVGAWDKAVDRRFVACKLAVVTRGDSALTLHVSDSRSPDPFIHLGQAPAPLRLRRQDLEAWLRAEVLAVNARLLASEARIAALEATRSAAQLYSDEEQTVMPVSSNGAVIPQRLRFTRSLTDPENWHDPVAYPTRVRVEFEGVMLITATATFAAGSGAGLRSLRLLKNNLPTVLAQASPGDPGFDTPVTLAGEVPVSPGDFLEIEPWQTSGVTLAVRPGATFSARRLL